MNEREQRIEGYFRSWIRKDGSELHNYFHPKAVYIESDGKEYRGMDSIQKWFEDWNKRGTVLTWDIKRFIHQSGLTAVEWYFQCRYEEKTAELDGMSLIEFDDNNRILSLHEFRSKVLHTYPYDKENL